jgi:hypothetical protein
MPLSVGRVVNQGEDEHPRFEALRRTQLARCLGFRLPKQQSTVRRNLPPRVTTLLEAVRGFQAS